MVEALGTPRWTDQCTAKVTERPAYSISGASGNASENFCYHQQIQTASWSYPRGSGLCHNPRRRFSSLPTAPELVQDVLPNFEGPMVASLMHHWTHFGYI